MDVTAASGIRFVHVNGARGARHMPESMAGGAGWIDHDGDGRLDLYLVNGSADPLDRVRDPAGPTNRLWRNRGDGTFEDVTERAGVGDRGYGFGLAVGDFDNDGRSDLYVTNVGRNVLYHNEGGGRFREVTEEAGVGCEAWSSSAAFLDFDADGWLDLWVCNYVVYDASRRCATRGIPTYCAPDLFDGAADVLYRNRGDGTFEDVSERAGIAVAGRHAGKSLGLVALDFDADGDTDVYVACDQVPNLLFRNLGDGRFEEVALLVDAAFSRDGRSQAGMGVDAGDVDLDGRPDIVVTNFAEESNAYYRNGGGWFEELSGAVGIGGPSLPMLGFGVLLTDGDLDGDLDLLVGNGHVLDNAAELRPSDRFAQRDQLFESLDGRGFREVSASAGDWFSREAVSRAVASADFDDDGDEDIAVVVNGGPLALLRNDGAHGAWIALDLEGRRSNRDGYGAVVELRIVGTGGAERRRRLECRTTRSYAAACDHRLRLGLGDGPVAGIEATVRWPSGIRQTVEDLAPGRVWTIEEPER